MCGCALFLLKSGGCSDGSACTAAAGTSRNATFDQTAMGQGLCRLVSVQQSPP